MHVACGRDLVLLLRHYDTLGTSGFVNDVIFSHTHHMAHHAYAVSRESVADKYCLGLNEILLNDTDQQVFIYLFIYLFIYHTHRGWLIEGRSVLCVISLL